MNNLGKLDFKPKRAIREAYLHLTFALKGLTAADLESRQESLYALQEKVHELMVGEESRLPPVFDDDFHLIPEAAAKRWTLCEIDHEINVLDDHLVSRVSLHKQSHSFEPQHIHEIGTMFADVLQTASLQTGVTLELVSVEVESNFDVKERQQIPWDPSAFIEPKH